MKLIPIAALLLAFFMVSPSAIAQDAISDKGEPRLEILSNKAAYGAGEGGFIVIRLDTFGKMDSARIELEITSPVGKFVEGDILYTDIPETAVVNPNTRQTAQVMYNEGIGYFGAGNSIIRIVEFEVPMDVSSGTYSITGRASGAGMSLEDSIEVSMSGPGGFMDVIFILYIAALLYSLYLLRKG
jgi:hypothetical protein